MSSAFEKYIFKRACSKGQFELAKNIVNSCQQLIHENLTLQNAFQEACFRGNLEVAKWLVDINPSALDDLAFRNVFRDACVFDHLEVARWLVEIRPYHYVLKLNQSQTKILGWGIRTIRDIRWLKRAVCILAYYSKTPNVFQTLNYDIIRYICEFV